MKIKKAAKKRATQGGERAKRISHQAASKEYPLVHPNQPVAGIGIAKSDQCEVPEETQQTLAKHSKEYPLVHPNQPVAGIGIAKSDQCEAPEETQQTLAKHSKEYPL